MYLYERLQLFGFLFGFFFDFLYINHARRDNKFAIIFVTLHKLISSIMKPIRLPALVLKNKESDRYTCES